MKALEQIISDNNKAVAKAKRQTRVTCDHSSYTGTIEGGIVLHSGKHRETRLLRHAAAHNFVNAWMDIPARLALIHRGMRRGLQQAVQHARDTLVESYF